MRKRIAQLPLFAALVGAAALALSVSGPARSLPPGTAVETYKGGLRFPVEMAWVHGTNRIFFIERFSGKVRILDGRRLLVAPCVRLNVASSGERGGLGLALDPDFGHNRLLYVYYTYAPTLENRVTRFRVDGNRCVDAQDVVVGIRASGEHGEHNGGKLAFLDGKLFVSAGDGEEEEASQELDDLRGKILRVNPDGSIPEGNPFQAGKAEPCLGVRPS